jgi:hypothetical protein
MTDRPRQMLVLVFALAQFLAPFFHAATGIGGPIGQRATPGSFVAPEQPAGYAFSIWFPIFTLALVYAVHQALPSQAANPVYRRIGAATAAMFAAGTVWMLWTQIMGSSWALLPMIYTIYGATMLAAARLGVRSRSAGERLGGLAGRILPPLLGLQGGWLTAAIVLNTTSVVRAGAPEPFGLDANVYALATLVPATLLALATIQTGCANGWFVGAFMWALVAVGVTNLVTAPNLPLAAMCGVALVAIAFSARNLKRTLSQI